MLVVLQQSWPRLHQQQVAAGLPGAAGCSSLCSMRGGTRCRLSWWRLLGLCCGASKTVKSIANSRQAAPRLGPPTQPAYCRMVGSVKGDP